MVIAVTNRTLCKDDFTERIRLILSSNPFEVILREKDLNDSDYEKLAESIIGNNEEYRKILSLNRPEIALRLGIENVHITMTQLNENGKPNGIKRTGVSIHSVEQAINAQKLGADYLIAGHIYATDCKKGVQPRGIDFFRNVCESVSIPVFAIGGICENNFYEPISVGGTGVCLMSEFMICDNPAERVKLYK
jgi:thiamine-phosphate pyrophosphorylase